MSYFSIKTSYLIMPQAIKQNKRIKFKVKKDEEVEEEEDGEKK